MTYGVGDDGPSKAFNISPEPGHLGNTSEVQRRQRLGGMLNYYYRAA